MNNVIRKFIVLKLLFLIAIPSFVLNSCERQRWRLAQREQRRVYYDSSRRSGYLRRDSIFRAQQDSIRINEAEKENRK